MTSSHDAVLRQERIEMLQAMMTAIDSREQLFASIDCVTDSTPSAAATAVQTAFGFNPLQANAVLALRVRNFGAQKRQLLEKELNELRSE